MRVHQQRAYILLNRPYSETSWVVETFSREHGRLAVMAKGARRFKSRLRGALLPFQPLLLSWSGKGEIPTLTSAEIDLVDYKIAEHELTRDGLVCGFYCNELIINLLHRYDPHPALFDHYHETVLALSDSQGVELATTLRDFERVLMKETGYEVSFDMEADGRTAVEDDGYYRYQSGEGFIRVAIQQPRTVSGRVIKSLASSFSGELSSAEVAQGKQLMRDILGLSLGRKKIVSRELFFPKAGNQEVRFNEARSKSVPRKMTRN